MAEPPELVAARAEVSQNPDIQFVLIASDRGCDTPERFRSFAQSRGLKLPLAFDVGGKAHDSLGLTGVPALGGPRSNRTSPLYARWLQCG
jgi:hypothetical protein